MRIQKNVAMFSGIISGLSLISAFFLQNDMFYSSILIGLFSSGMLTCAVATISYFGERNRALYALYSGCYNFMKALNRNLSYDNTVNVRDLRNNFSVMIDTYMKDVYIYVCQLSSVNNHSKIHGIVMDIWEPTRRIYLRVSADESQLMRFFCQDISEDELRNYHWQYNSDESIQDIQMLHKALDKLMYHMNYYNVKKESRSEVSDNAD